MSLADALRDYTPPPPLRTTRGKCGVGKVFDHLYATNDTLGADMLGKAFYQPASRWTNVGLARFLESQGFSDVGASLVGNHRRGACACTGSS